MTKTKVHIKGQIYRKAIVIDLSKFSNEINNPFLKDVKIRLKPDIYDIDIENNRTLIQAMKLYSTQDTFIALRKPAINKLTSLSKSGLMLFGYVCNNMKFGKSVIPLKADLISETCQCSDKTVYRGIGELEKKKFIAKVDGTHYWFYINYRYIGFGSVLDALQDELKNKSVIAYILKILENKQVEEEKLEKSLIDGSTFDRGPVK